MPNPFYAYIKYMISKHILKYMISKHIFRQAWAVFFNAVKWFHLILNNSV